MLDLEPEVSRRVQAWIAYLGRFGIRLRVTSTTRSSAQQARLYNAWLARGRRGLPAAPPGTSTHEYGYAVDVVPVSGSIEPAASVAGCFGLVWFGPGDPVHFDVFGPRVWREILAGRAAQSIDYSC